MSYFLQPLRAGSPEGACIEKTVPVVFSTDDRNRAIRVSAPPIIARRRRPQLSRLLGYGIRAYGVPDFDSGLAAPR